MKLSNKNFKKVQNSILEGRRDSILVNSKGNQVLSIYLIKLGKWAWILHLLYSLVSNCRVQLQILRKKTSQVHLVTVREGHKNNPLHFGELSPWCIIWSLSLPKITHGRVTDKNIKSIVNTRTRHDEYNWSNHSEAFWREAALNILRISRVNTPRWVNC